jgi:hypothetical protein
MIKVSAGYWHFSGMTAGLALAMLVTRYGSVDYLFPLMLCALLLAFMAQLIERVSKTKESN